MASTLFLIQNDYFNWVLERSRSQDAARSVVDLVGEDVRSVLPGGFVTADSTRMVVRRPLAMGVICDKFGSIHVVHVPGGQEGFDTDEVSGFGLRAADGSWTFTDRSWGGLYGGTFYAATLCAAEGADTVGASSEFYLFGDLEGLSGQATSIGDVITLYRELELRFATSELDPSTRALYRGTEGATLVEFATGLSPSAHFSYRTGDTTHVASVGGGDLDDIDGVRIHAYAEAPDGSVVREDVKYDLVANLLLRNAG